MAPHHVQLQTDQLKRIIEIAEANVSGMRGYDIYEQAIHAPRRATKMKGHERYRLMKEGLDNLPSGFKLSNIQRQLTNPLLKCLVPMAFDEDFDSHQAEIMQQYGLTELRSDLIALYPRRFGKTTAASSVS